MVKLRFTEKSTTAPSMKGTVRITDMVEMKEADSDVPPFDAKTVHTCTSDDILALFNGASYAFVALSVAAHDLGDAYDKTSTCARDLVALAKHRIGVAVPCDSDDTAFSAAVGAANRVDSNAHAATADLSKAKYDLARAIEANPTVVEAIVAATTAAHAAADRANATARLLLPWQPFTKAEAVPKPVASSSVYVGQPDTMCGSSSPSKIERVASSKIFTEQATSNGETKETTSSVPRFDAGTSTVKSLRDLLRMLTPSTALSDMIETKDGSLTQSPMDERDDQVRCNRESELIPKTIWE